MKGRSPTGPSVSRSSTFRLLGPETLNPTVASEMSRTSTSGSMWSSNQRMCHSRK